MLKFHGKPITRNKKYNVSTPLVPYCLTEQAMWKFNGMQIASNEKYIVSSAHLAYCLTELPPNALRDGRKAPVKNAALVQHSSLIVSLSWCLILRGRVEVQRQAITNNEKYSV